MSTVVVSRDRPEALARVMACLARQDQAPSEVVVVDDGTLPVRLPATAPPSWTVLRTGGVERSAARNAGAGAATGDVIVFIDDDIEVVPTFVRAHATAHREWPDSLAVGSIRLPSDVAGHFVSFRQRLEDASLPSVRGPVAGQAFCTAANMSVRRATFLALGGFDAGLVSAEDQDFALRFVASGRTVVFIPEAAAVHRDTALDIAGYARRVEWGARMMVPFIRKHPDLRDNVARLQVNGPTRWRSDGPALVARKVMKAALGATLLRAAVLKAAALPVWMPRRLRDRLYVAVIGIHLQRGFRRGLRELPGP